MTYRIAGPFWVGGICAWLALGGVLVWTAANRYVPPGDPDPRAANVVSVLIVLVAGGAFAAVWAGRTAVRISPTRLVIRSLFRTTSLAWNEILAVDETKLELAVTSRTGTYVVPMVLRSGSVSFTLAGRMFTLGDPAGWPDLASGIGARWVERRGAAWFSRPLDPWRPAYDFDGRVVLRNPFVRRAATVLLLPLTITYANASEGIVAFAIMFGTFGGATLLILFVLHWVDALVIDAEHVVVRSVLRTHRIPRHRILGVTIDQASATGTLAAFTARRSVTIRTMDGTVHCFAPASGGSVAHDPLFLRKAAWLAGELRPAAPSDPAGSASPEATHSLLPPPPLPTSEQGH